MAPGLIYPAISISNLSQKKKPKKKKNTAKNTTITWKGKKKKNPTI